MNEYEQRLLELKEEMQKTPEGREALAQVIADLEAGKYDT